MATKKSAAVTKRARTTASAQRSETGTPTRRPRSVTKTEETTTKPAKAKKGDGFVMPKTFAGIADLLYTTRQERLAIQKKIDELAKREAAMKNYLIDNMSKKDATGAAGKVARVQLEQVEEPQTQDWDLLYKHLKKTGEFDLLNRALNKSAVKARWENGKKVPGVGSFMVTKVSCTKV